MLRTCGAGCLAERAGLRARGLPSQRRLGYHALGGLRRRRAESRYPASQAAWILLSRLKPAPTKKRYRPPRKRGTAPPEKEVPGPTPKGYTNQQPTGPRRDAEQRNATPDNDTPSTKS